jgi:hypothetical protein
VSTPPSTPAGIDPAQVTPGVLGFLVVVALGLATWVLLRSLGRHLGRVRFDERADGTGTGSTRPERAPQPPERPVPPSDPAPGGPPGSR